MGNIFSKRREKLPMMILCYVTVIFIAIDCCGSAIKGISLKAECSCKKEDINSSAFVWKCMLWK
jgi:hypothetical protein